MSAVFSLSPLKEIYRKPLAESLRSAPLNPVDSDILVRYLSRKPEELRSDEALSSDLETVPHWPLSLMVAVGESYHAFLKNVTLGCVFSGFKTEITADLLHCFANNASMVYKRYRNITADELDRIIDFDRRFFIPFLTRASPRRTLPTLSISDNIVYDLLSLWSKTLEPYRD